jgi:hypothetical protein
MGRVNGRAPWIERAHGGALPPRARGSTPRAGFSRQSSQVLPGGSRAALLLPLGASNTKQHGFHPCNDVLPPSQRHGSARAPSLPPTDELLPGGGNVASAGSGVALVLPRAASSHATTCFRRRNDTGAPGHLRFRRPTSCFQVEGTLLPSEAVSPSCSHGLLSPGSTAASLCATTCFRRRNGSRRRGHGRFRRPTRCFRVDTVLLPSEAVLPSFSHEAVVPLGIAPMFVRAGLHSCGSTFRLVLLLFHDSPSPSPCPQPRPALPMAVRGIRSRTPARPAHPQALGGR